MKKIENNTLIIDVVDNKIVKKIKKIIKYCDKNNFNVKFNINNKELDKSLKEVEKALNIKDKEKRYNYIYDRICFDLDEKIKTNYCEFCNDICFRDREKNNNHKNGCCECAGRGKCKYLINSECTMKTCMACKLFTCPALKKKGIKQSINDFVLSNFFDSKEKYILENSFWTPKEIVMERLLKKKYISPFKEVQNEKKYMK